MNYFIKTSGILLLLKLNYAFGFSPILIEYEKSLKHARMVESILTNDYQIPHFLIEIRSSQREYCELTPSGVEIHLCIRTNNDLEIIDVKKRFIKETLSVFFKD